MARPSGQAAGLPSAVLSAWSPQMACRGNAALPQWHSCHGGHTQPLRVPISKFKESKESQVGVKAGGSLGLGVWGQLRKQ